MSETCWLVKVFQLATNWDAVRNLESLDTCIRISLRFSLAVVFLVRPGWCNFFIFPVFLYHDEIFSIVLALQSNCMDITALPPKCSNFGDIIMNKLPPGAQGLILIPRHSEMTLLERFYQILMFICGSLIWGIYYFGSATRTNKLIHHENSSYKPQYEIS